jgi:hypothetical protein
MSAQPAPRPFAREVPPLSVASSDIPWKFGPVTGVVHCDDVLLTHDVERAELRVRHGRLYPGRGYARASAEARHILARAGAIQRLRARGRYHVHAAGVVDPHGRAWLLAGDSGSGKSTLSYALARAGWRVLGDDGVVVERAGAAVRCHPWREPMRLSDALVAHFPELTRWAHGANAADARRRMPVPVPAASAAHLCAIVFVRFAASDALHRMAPLEALAGLVRQSRWVMVNDCHAPAHLALLALMAQGVPVMQLEHSPRALHALPRTLLDALEPA